MRCLLDKLIYFCSVGKNGKLGHTISRFLTLCCANLVPEIDAPPTELNHDATRGTLPPDLVHEVRSALVHLYDFAYLQNHALAIRLARDPRNDNVTRAQQLRRLLLDAIESLRPQTQPNSDSARAYAVLTYRCIDSLTIEEIEAKLGLSRRQIYREYARGVEAVTGQLWDVLSRLGAYEPAGNSPLSPPIHAAPTGQPHTNAAAAPISPQNWGAGGAPAARHALAKAELERLSKEVRYEIVSVGDVLAGVCTLLAPRMQQRGIQITAISLASAPPVMADRTLLRQALLNLLSHALDTLTCQGELLVSTSKSGGNVHFCFHQSPASHTGHDLPAPVPRDGVALTVAQTLVTAQHGTLTFGSAGDAWQAELVLPTAQMPTVLVVDDNADLVELFQRYLAGHRLTVVGATSGREALALAAQLRPQMIMLDVMMPQQDGWDVLQALRHAQASAATPIIICSVLREPELARSLGATDTLVKPVSQTNLLAVTRRWLGRLHPLG